MRKFRITSGDVEKLSTSGNSGLEPRAQAALRASAPPGRCRRTRPRLGDLPTAGHVREQLVDVPLDDVRRDAGAAAEASPPQRRSAATEYRRQRSAARCTRSR